MMNGNLFVKEQIQHKGNEKFIVRLNIPFNSEKELNHHISDVYNNHSKQLIEEDLCIHIKFKPEEPNEVLRSSGERERN